MYTPTPTVVSLLDTVDTTARADAAAAQATADLAAVASTLGTASVQDVGYFATAAQGATADLAAVASTLGTASVQDVGYFATAAQGTTADTQAALSDLMKLAMSGDMVLKCTPTTAGSSAATVAADIAGGAGKFVRNVVVTLETAAGAVHTWFSGKRDAAAAVVTAGDGTAAITGSATDITFVAGSVTVAIDYTLTWAAADTCTLTVTGGTLLGYAVADKTSVDTLIA